MGKKKKPWYMHKEWYGVGGTVQTGDAAEEAFRKIAENHGFMVIKSTREEDMRHHIDFFLDDDQSVLSVDVKARKKISRRDANYCDDWTYVEFRLPMGGKGWLYHEDVDLIAFETPDDFIIVERDKLRQLAEVMVDRNTVVSDPHDAKYKGFTRRDKELVALVETKWVRAISKWIWPKDQAKWYKEITDQSIIELGQDPESY